jgi:hypothetical protein
MSNQRPLQQDSFLTQFETVKLVAQLLATLLVVIAAYFGVIVPRGSLKRKTAGGFTGQYQRICENLDKTD